MLSQPWRSSLSARKMAVRASQSLTVRIRRVLAVFGGIREINSQLPEHLLKAIQHSDR